MPASKSEIRANMLKKSMCQPDKPQYWLPNSADFCQMTDSTLPQN